MHSTLIGPRVHSMIVGTAFPIVIVTFFGRRPTTVEVSSFATEFHFRRKSESGHGAGEAEEEWGGGGGVGGGGGAGGKGRAASAGGKGR